MRIAAHLRGQFGLAARGQFELVWRSQFELVKEKY